MGTPKANWIDISRNAFFIGSSSATSSAGAATLNAQHGVITTQSLTTAAGATFTLTVTNNRANTTDRFIVTVSNGTNTTGTPCLATVTCSTNGTIVIVIQNIHASAAFNGTLKVSLMRIATA